MNREVLLQTLIDTCLEGWPALEFAQDVNSGRIELWEFRNAAMAAVEFMDDRAPPTCYIWCLAGSDLINVSKDIRILALRRGYTRVAFRTQHHGLIRILSHYRPRSVRALSDKHMEYEIDL